MPRVLRRGDRSRYVAKRRRADRRTTAIVAQARSATPAIRPSGNGANIIPSYLLRLRQHESARPREYFSLGRQLCRRRGASGRSGREERLGRGGGATPEPAERGGFDHRRQGTQTPTDDLGKVSRSRSTARRAAPPGWETETRVRSRSNAGDARRERVGRRAGTELEDYTVADRVPRRRRSTRLSAGASGAIRQCRSAPDQAITCTITNTLKPPSEHGSLPTLECVLFTRTENPTSRYWGYKNTNGPPGRDSETMTANRTSSSPAARGPGQPDGVRGRDEVGGVRDCLRRRRQRLDWHLTGRSVSADSGSEPVQRDDARSGRSSSRRATRADSSSRINAPAASPVATGRPRSRSGRGRRGHRERDRRAGDEPRRLRLEGGVHAEGPAAARPRGPSSTPRSPQDDNVVCTFTNRAGTRPEPPQPLPRPARPRPRPRRRPKPPKPPPQLDLERRASGRSRQSSEVGSRITWTMTVTNRSTVAATDVNGVKVDDPRSFQTRRISLPPVPGHLPAVPVRPRSSRPRRLGDRRRRDRGDAGRRGRRTSSESARGAGSRTTATTSRPP